jgi:ubiquinone/menaquinone biosynthesis C-methylase UbiE
MLIKAWGDVNSRELIIKAVKCGYFKFNPELADGFIQVIDNMYSLGLSSQNIYKNLRKYFNQVEPALKKSNFSNDIKERLVQRAKEAANMLEGYNPLSMLDIGCGDCHLTSNLQAALKLPIENVSGLEVFLPKNRKNIIKIKKFDGKHVPYPDNSQDLITLFTVLHHIQGNPINYLKEIYRTLKPGGRLLIREFDSNNESHKSFLHVMDEMLYKVYNPAPEINPAINYHGLNEWVSMFKEVGFKISKPAKKEDSNIYRPFIIVLEK